MNSLKPFLFAALSIMTPVAANAQVTETFATFSPIGTGSNVYWDNNVGTSAGTGGTFVSTGNAGSTVFGTRSVTFSFLRPELAAVTNATANFSLNASAGSGNAATSFGPAFAQGGIAGNFSFVSTQVYTIGATTFATGSNLLSGAFGNALITGVSTTGATLGTNTSSQTLSFTSDFFDASSLTNVDFAMALSAITPSLFAAPGSALRDFGATASGNFSGGFAAAVPEPGTWAMMIIGFGFVGGTLRYRRRKSAFAIA